MRRSIWCISWLIPFTVTLTGFLSMGAACGKWLQDEFFSYVYPVVSLIPQILLVGIVFISIVLIEYIVARKSYDTLTIGGLYNGGNRT
jgi:hypothetical protein